MRLSDREEFDRRAAEHAGHDFVEQAVSDKRIAICSTCDDSFTFVPPSAPAAPPRAPSPFLGDRGPVRIPRTPGVYFAYGAGTQRVKIGMSLNVRARLSNLDTSSAVGVHLMAWQPGPRDERALKEAEDELHARFADLSVRARSEWFRLEGALADHVNEVRAADGYGPFDLALFDVTKDRASEAVEITPAYEAAIRRFEKFLPGHGEVMRKLLATKRFDKPHRKEAQLALVQWLDAGGVGSVPVGHGPFTLSKWRLLMGPTRYRGGI